MIGLASEDNETRDLWTLEHFRIIILASAMTAYQERDVKYAIMRVVSKLGYKDLHQNEEEEAVKSFIGGKGFFVCLPTGSGKIFCYCVLPMYIL